MNTLEQLKELATTSKRLPDETVGSFADRWNSENRWVRDIALPLLLEVAEAARYAQEWLEEDGIAIKRLDAALAKLTEEGKV